MAAGLFGGVSLRERCLFPPADGKPLYPPDNQSCQLESFYGYRQEVALGTGFGGYPFYPSRIPDVLLPPLVAHPWHYILDTLLLVLSAAYYLGGRGCRGVSACLPAVALGASGYAFSLISAGHRGVFDMLPYAVFIFGLIDRALERRSWLDFAMIGACATWGLSAQPDIMGLFLLLAGAYGCFRLIRVWQRGQTLPLLRRCLLGGILASTIFCLGGMGFFGNLFRNIVPARETMQAQTAADKWEFCTNWSMPPEEILEFVAPGVFGIETGDPRAPYWGRVGRSLGWDPTRPGLMNLKQHTVYLGVIQLLIGAYGVAWAVSRRRRDGLMVESQEPSPALSRPDVLFWAATFVITVLLALGRYFPLYRLFFLLPYAQKIRAPIKFIHLSELALCVLFAAGLAAYLRDARAAESGTRPPLRRRSFWIGALGAGLCLGLAAIRWLFAGGMAGYWRELGLEAYAPVLREAMRGGLTHGMVLSGLVAAVCLANAFAGRQRQRIALYGMGLLTMAVFADLVLVGKPYVRTRDVAGFYAPSPLMTRLREEKTLGRVSYPVSSFRTTQNPLWCTFCVNGIYPVEPAQGHPVPDSYRELFNALQGNTPRLWQLSSTRYVIGPSSSLAALKQDTRFEGVTGFDALMDGRIEERPLGQGNHTVYRFKDGLPRAQLYHQWESVDATTALARLADAAWDPARMVLVEDASGSHTAQRAPSPVELEVYGRTRIVVRTDAPEEGILLVTDQYDPDWHVTVDGRSADLLRANGIMLAVGVPAGRHKVVFTYHPFALPFGLSLAVCVGLLGWQAVRLMGKRRRHEAV